MAENRLPTRVLSGQVLPPQPRAGHLPATRPGIPLLVEVRNWSERKQVESLVKLERARNELGGLLVAQYELVGALRKARERELAQLEHLPTIRAIEEHRVLDELDQLREATTARKLRAQIQKLDLERQLIEARRARDAAKRPPAPPAAPVRVSTEDRIKTRLEEIDGIERVFRERQEAIVKSAGGEDNLTEDDRRRLDQLDVQLRTMLERLQEELL